MFPCWCHRFGWQTSSSQPTTAGAAVTAERLLPTDDPRPRVRSHTCVLRPASLFPSNSEPPRPRGSGGARGRAPLRRAWGPRPGPTSAPPGTGGGASSVAGPPAPFSPPSAGCSAAAGALLLGRGRAGRGGGRREGGRQGGRERGGGRCCGGGCVSFGHIPRPVRPPGALRYGAAAQPAPAAAAAAAAPRLAPAAGRWMPSPPRTGSQRAAVLRPSPSDRSRIGALARTRGHTGAHARPGVGGGQAEDAAAGQGQDLAVKPGAVARPPPLPPFILA